MTLRGGKARWFRGWSGGFGGRFREAQRKLASGPGKLLIALVGFDDSLDQAVPHYVPVIEVDEAHAFHAAQNLHGID